MNGIRSLIGFKRSLLAGCVYSFFALSCGNAESTLSREEHLINQMCNRGLGQAALRYVRGRRAIERDEQAVAWWAMREMECHAQLGLVSRSDADKHWAACKQVSDEYLQSFNKPSDQGANPREPWIQWQLGRCLLLESQSRLAWTLANPANATERDRALELVRAILQLTDELQVDIQRRQPLAARQTSNDATQVPAEQLRNLSADTQLLRCEAMIVRSQLYLEGTADRSASLAEVGVLARDVLSRTGGDWPMRSALLLAQASASLESGDDSAIIALQKLMSQAEVPPRIRLLAGLALARAHSRRGQLSLGTSVLDGLEELTSETNELAANWKFAKIELAYWELKQLAIDQRPDALRKLAEQTKELGTLHGDYWRTRAEGLLVSGLSSQEVPDTQLARDLLLAEVRQLTAAGQIELACGKLTLARDIETRAGNGESALELSNMAAVLFRHIERWEEAANAIEKTAYLFHQSKLAPDAHLLAIRDRAETIRVKGESMPTTQAYQKSLEEHLRLWPHSISARQVEIWLRELILTRGGRRQLIDSLVNILSTASPPLNVDNQLSMLLEQCVLFSEPSGLAGILDELESRTDFVSREVHIACRAAVYSAWALTDGGGLADWNPPDVLEERHRFLHEWLTAEPVKSPSVYSPMATALAMDCFRLDTSLPKDIVPDFNALSPEMRISVGPMIVALLDAGNESDRRDAWSAAGLHAEWASSTLGSKSPDTSRMLKERPICQAALARIAILLGDSEQLDALHQLAQQHSKNGTVQLMLANCLLQQQQVAEAKQLATKVAAMSQPGRVLHWSARWCLIRALLQEGRTEEAVKTARLMIATQPGMNQVWNNRFEEIARR